MILKNDMSSHRRAGVKQSQRPSNRRPTDSIYDNPKQPKREANTACSYAVLLFYGFWAKRLLL